MKEKIKQIAESWLMEDLIGKIIERWFVLEPLLFSVYCTHQLVSNASIHCFFRSGKKRIEYNPELLKSLQESEIEEYLKIELIRILLKHPYQRQPDFPDKAALAYASNITISENYDLKVSLEGVGIWPLPHNLCFEEYYEQVKAILSSIPANKAGLNKETELNNEISSNNGDIGESEYNFESIRDSSSSEAVPKRSGGMEPKGGTADSPTGIEDDGNARKNIENINFEETGEISELWEENQEMECGVNEMIENANNSGAWGNLSQKLKDIISGSLLVEMDYKKMLSLFKTSVVSSRRKLTRMRPSRRYGLLQMGSLYEIRANILVAVDVSGSISEKNLQQFFSIINRFFKYGVEKIDVVQFDTKLVGDALEMKNARSKIKISGRGGTDFQPAADYYCSHPEYDGLIYFTDGCAPSPEFKTKRIIDVLWVLAGKKEYEEHKNRLKKIKRNRVIWIPGIGK